MDLARRLFDLDAERAAGRVDVIGSAGGRIYLDGGNVVCAEQHGHQTLLLAMADGGLFSPADWAAALQAPLANRWRLLVASDGRRLRRLVEFARDFTTTHLNAIVDGAPASAVFVPGSTHALGALTSWPLCDLLEAKAAPAPLDRSEFLELVSEISPTVRARP